MTKRGTLAALRPAFSNPAKPEYTDVTESEGLAMYIEKINAFKETTQTVQQETERQRVNQKLLRSVPKWKA